jgi:hypothetical protein
MKYLVTISLLFISIIAYCQQGNLTTIKLKTGLETEVKVLSIEKNKMTIEKAGGANAVITADVIESIDGMSYEDFLLGFQNGTSNTTNFPLNEAGEIEYTEVVQVDGVSANELYVRAKEWLALTFVSSKSVIQLEDKEAGKIIGKGISEIFASPFSGERTYSYGYIEFTLEIQVKEGRCKYKISNISHDFGEQSNGLGGSMVSLRDLLAEPKPSLGLVVPNKKMWGIIRNASDKEIKGIINSFKEKITSKSDRSSDDW